MASAAQIPQRAVLQAAAKPLSAVLAQKSVVRTLEAAFSRSQGRPVRIRQLRAELCEQVSSFQAHRLRVTLDTGEQIGVFFKDLNPEHQIQNAQKVRAGDLGPSYLELRVYRHILSRLALGTPQLYAVRWEPKAAIYWIFLEDVGRSRLRDCRTDGPWIAAARWAARFHVAADTLPARCKRFLPVYDRAHYERCAERARGILPGLSLRDRALIARALGHYGERIEWFAKLPRTAIHGQFFGKNIMRRNLRGEQSFAVIDWETAALGPGGFDLVSLSAGHWTPTQRRAFWRAYFDEHQRQSGNAGDWNDFCQELREIEIYQALEWVGWWRNRSTSHNFGRWVEELSRILKDRARAA